VNFDFHVPHQVREAAKSHHAVHRVQASTETAERKQSCVFDNGATVDFGMVLDYGSAGN
jgi:hypothetical protein